MKRHIKIYLLFLAAIFLFVLSNYFNGENSINNEKKKDIALVLKTNADYYSKIIKMGADAAAREFNINLIYNAPDAEGDIDGLVKLVNQAIDNKVDALVLSVGHASALEEVTQKALKLKIPVVMIDAGMEDKNVQSVITTDNLDAGEKAVEEIIGISGLKSNVAIISPENGGENLDQREAGLLSELSRYNQINVLRKKYNPLDRDTAFNNAKEILGGSEKIDIIVALDSTATESAGDAAIYMNTAKDVKIIGFGSTIKIIEHLENGVIEASVIENPYSMGYLGVKTAVDILNRKSVPRLINTSSKIIYSNTIYLPENQKLLFPFVN